MILCALGLAFPALATDLIEPSIGDLMGLRALSLDAGIDGAVATPEGLVIGYTRACELGWTTGCRLADLVEDGATVGGALAEACEEGDALSCLPAAWALETSDPPAAVHVLGRLCGVGVARACTDLARLSWHGIGLPVEKTESLNTLRAACDVGIGRACTLVGTLGHANEAQLTWVERGCKGHDALGCVAAGDLFEAASDRAEEGSRFTTDEGQARYQRACRLGHVRACAEVSEHLQRSTTHRGRQRGVALAGRGCDRNDAQSCLVLGESYAAGLGVPADPERASDLFHQACRLDHGGGCARLADLILAEQAQGYALSPRDLYGQSCDLDHADGCSQFASFDRDLRRSPGKLIRAGYVRYMFFPTVRPYLGGSASLVAEVALPRVDAYATRRRLTLTTDLGAGDYTFGVFDLTQEQEDLSFLALDWRQGGDRWGFRVGVGSQVWAGAPYYGANTEAWPAQPLFVYPYRSVVPRVDVSHPQLFGRYSGVRLSTAMVIANEQLDTVPLGLFDLSASDLRGDTLRATVSVFRDRHQGRAAPMRGAASELSAFAGVTFGLGPQWGVVLSDLRAFPLVRSAGDRAAVSLVTDGFASVRGGALPLWLEHHHTPRLSPNVGGWRLLRGYPAALMAGRAAARGGAELRWTFAEYHGMSRSIGFVLAPWIEVGASAGELTATDLQEAVWRSNGGGALTVTWSETLSLRFETIAIPQQGDRPWRVVPALTIEQALDPWD